AAKPPANALMRPVVVRTAPPPSIAPFAAREPSLSSRAGKAELGAAAGRESANTAPTPKVKLVAPSTPTALAPRGESRESQPARGSLPQARLPGTPEPEKSAPTALRPAPSYADGSRPQESDKALPEAIRRPAPQANGARPPELARPPQEALMRPSRPTNFPRPAESPRSAPGQALPPPPPQPALPHPPEPPQ